MDTEALRRSWENRQRRPRARRLGELLLDVAAHIGKEEGRKDRELRALWQRVLPNALVGRARFLHVRGSDVHIAVCETSYRFEVERVVGPDFLREAGTAFPTWKLKRVRVVLEDGPEAGMQD